MNILSKFLFSIHRTCKTVQHIPHIALGVRETDDFKRLQVTMNEHLRKLDDFTRERTDDIDKLTNLHHLAQESLQKLREKINKLIDKLEKDCACRLEEMYKKLDERLHEKITKGMLIREQMQILLTTMKEEENYAETLAFLAYKKSQDKLLESDDLLNSMGKSQFTISFKANPEVESCLAQLETLGELQTGVQDWVKEQDHVYKVTGSKAHKISVKSDKKVNEIWGGCQLTDGSFVLADTGNQKVKLLNSQFILKSCMDISPMYPNSVCQISAQEVAVSTGCDNDRKEIWLISTKNGWLTLNDRLKLDHICGCIAFRNGHLFVSSNTALYVYTQSGHVISKLHEDTSGKVTIHNFAISHDGRRIYITNMDKHQLITLDASGNKLATFTDPKLKRPTGICIAPNRTIFVNGYDTATVMQVDSNGKTKLSTVANHAEGVYGPYSLMFVQNPSRLLVGQVSDTILSFELS